MAVRRGRENFRYKMLWHDGKKPIVCRLMYTIGKNMLKYVKKKERESEACRREP